MFYITDANDHGFPHDPFKAIVTPRPIGWIGSIDKDGSGQGLDFNLLNFIPDDSLKNVILSGHQRKL